MTVAIGGLRQRVSEDRRDLEAPPKRLRHAIADFEAQIDAMNARLRDLAYDPRSTQGSR